MDNHLVVSEQGLTAYDSISLAIRWQRLSGERTHAPVLAAGLVLVSSSSGFYALDSTNGSVVWQSNRDINLFAPVVKDGVVYLASESGVLQALELAGGRLIWRRQLPGWIYPPGLGSELLYTGGSDGNLWAIHLEDGSIRWRRDLGQELVYSPVILRDGTVITTTFAGEVFAFSPMGRLHWQSRLSVNFMPPFELGERILFSGIDQQLYALDSKTGKRHWSTSLDGRLAAPLVLNKHTALAALDDGRLLEIDPQDGNLRLLGRADGEPVASPHVQDGQTVLFLKSFGAPKAIILKRQQSGVNSIKEM